MAVERPAFERMTLRQLLSSASKVTRELADLSNKDYQSRLADLHDLSRPTRRRSHFPSILSLSNSVAHHGETAQQLLDAIDVLEEHIVRIREQARLARLERL
jgi:hypothetical protein